MEIQVPCLFHSWDQRWLLSPFMDSQYLDMKSSRSGEVEEMMERMSLRERDELQNWSKPP